MHGLRGCGRRTWARGPLHRMLVKVTMPQLAGTCDKTGQSTPHTHPHLFIGPRRYSQKTCHAQMTKANYTKWAMRPPAVPNAMHMQWSAYKKAKESSAVRQPRGGFTKTHCESCSSMVCLKRALLLFPHPKRSPKNPHYTAALATMPKACCGHIQVFMAAAPLCCNAQCNSTTTWLMPNATQQLQAVLPQRPLSNQTKANLTTLNKGRRTKGYQGIGWPGRGYENPGWPGRQRWRCYRHRIGRNHDSATALVTVVAGVTIRVAARLTLAIGVPKEPALRHTVPANAPIRLCCHLAPTYHGRMPVWKLGSLCISPEARPGGRTCINGHEKDGCKRQVSTTAF